MMSEEVTTQSSRPPLKPITGNEGSRGKKFGGFRPSRRDQNLAKLETMDKLFKGADEDFGSVIGLSNELPHLTHGKICGEFQDALLIHVQSKYVRGGDLRPLILDLKDPMKKLQKLKPKYDVEEGTDREKEQIAKERQMRQAVQQGYDPYYGH